MHHNNSLSKQSQTHAQFLSRSLFKRADWILAAVLSVITALAYGFYSPNLGFHYDDSGWFIKVVAGQPQTILEEMFSYIPGRNLFVVWFHTFLRLAGNPVTHLPELHFLLSVLDGLLVGMFYLVLRAMCVAAPAAVLAAAMFGFWPLHGETHYWMNDLSENLMSSFWLFIFCCTSVALVRNPKSVRVWIFDVIALLCTLFTYEQPFFFVYQIIAVRIFVCFYIRGRAGFSFALMHIPYAIFSLLYVAMKMAIQDGESPTLTGDVPATILRNSISTTRKSFGDPFFELMQSFFAQATSTEIILACAAAAAIGIAALWSRREEQTISPRWFWLLVAVFFYVGCYFPVWIWHPAARHNLLPSIPLFFAVAVLLDWLLHAARWNSLRVVVIGLGCLPVAYFAAASFSENHFWGNAYRAKAAMLTELCPSFPEHDTLILENFPPTIGSSTPLIAFQDTQYAPRLLCPGLLKDPEFAGDVGGTLAPGGTFLGVRRMIWGEGNFSFRKDSKPLFVKFNALNGDRFNYSVFEPPSPQYEVTSVHKEPSKIHSEKMPLSAKQLSDAVELSIETPAVTPGAHLAAVIHYYANGNRLSWNESEGQNPLYVHPILLSPSSNNNERINLTVQLKSFPQAEHIELTFYEVRDQGAPRRLQSMKAPVLSDGQA